MPKKKMESFRKKSTNKLQIKSETNASILQISFVRSATELSLKILEGKKFFSPATFVQPLKKIFVRRDRPETFSRPWPSFTNRSWSTSVLAHVWNDRMIARPSRCLSSSGLFSSLRASTLDKGKIVLPSRHNKNLTIRRAAFDVHSLRAPSSVREVGKKFLDIPLVCHASFLFLGLLSEYFARRRRF